MFQIIFQFDSREHLFDYCTFQLEGEFNAYTIVCFVSPLPMTWIFLRYPDANV